MPLIFRLNAVNAAFFQLNDVDTAIFPSSQLLTPLFLRFNVVKADIFPVLRP